MYSRVHFDIKGFFLNLEDEKVRYTVTVHSTYVEQSIKSEIIT